MSEKIVNELKADLEKFFSIVERQHRKSQETGGMKSLHAQVAALMGATFVAEFAELNELEIGVTPDQLLEGGLRGKLQNIAFIMSEKLKKGVDPDARLACDLAISWNSVRNQYSKRYPTFKLPPRHTPSKEYNTLCVSTPKVTKTLRNIIRQALKR